MIVSEHMKKLIDEQEGWTRKMFEEGLRLKREYGDENVYDFSLGNPDVEPPEALIKTLIDLLSQNTPGTHRYMENNGYAAVREMVSRYLSERFGLPFTPLHVFMTVGCAGGINTLLKTVMNRGDEVIVPKPFFWEFKNYVENFGGTLRLVDTKEDFQLDIEKIEEAINDRTKAVLINSPNNPTGVVYDERAISELCGLLTEKRKEGKDIFLISDDAYRKLVYENMQLPNIFKKYDLVISVTSHSKDLALPGERIGYIAISPKIADAALLVSGLMISSRSLGFVNAPALFQRAVGAFQDKSVDISDYQYKRDLLYNALVESGFDVVKPMGAFYIFPRCPMDDELEFIRTMQQEERILVVPGRGFGAEGYFRIAYCGPLNKITASLDGFRRMGERYIKKG